MPLYSAVNNIQTFGILVFAAERKKIKTQTSGSWQKTILYTSYHISLPVVVTGPSRCTQPQVTHSYLLAASSPLEFLAREAKMNLFEIITLLWVRRNNKDIHNHQKEFLVIPCGFSQIEFRMSRRTSDTVRKLH